MPQLTDEQTKLLEGHVTITQIDEAISSLQSDKSPVADGFCLQFYKKMNSKINKLLQRMFSKSFEEDELPKSMYLAHIIVIPQKGKHPELCASYCLLGVDVKILSKIEGNRRE